MLNKVGSTHEYIFNLDLNELKKLGYDAVLLREMRNDTIAIDVQILELSDGIEILYGLMPAEDDGIPFLQFEAEPGSFDISEDNIVKDVQLFFKGELDGINDETYEDMKRTINTMLFTLSEANTIVSFKNNKYYTEDGFRVVDEEGYSAFINSDKYKKLKSKNIKNTKTMLKNETKGDKIVKIDFKGKNE